MNVDNTLSWEIHIEQITHILRQLLSSDISQAFQVTVNTEDFFLWLFSFCYKLWIKILGE